MWMEGDMAAKIVLNIAPVLLYIACQPKQVL